MHDDLHDNRPFLDELDAFIDAEIAPLETEGDNAALFDHRREFARTDTAADGNPSAAWVAVLREARRLADRAGILRYTLPRELGGRAPSITDVVAVREHLARRGPGLHNDLQSKFSVVENFSVIDVLLGAGTPEQIAELCEPLITGDRYLAFGLTEPDHGSSVTWLETTAERDGDHWVVNGGKRLINGVNKASDVLVFARTSGTQGRASGISALIVPVDTPGFDVPYYWWPLSMPAECAEIELHDVRVPLSAMLGEEGRGFASAARVLDDNRLRQAATSIGTARFCLEQTVAHVKGRLVAGEPLADRQAVQWPLAELHTETELLRSLIYQTARTADRDGYGAVGAAVSMCNYRAARLACAAADQAIQLFGGVGYTRHLPFEALYRDHRLYRIAEGTDEMQIRRIAADLFDAAS